MQIPQYLIFGRKYVIINAVPHS